MNFEKANTKKPKSSKLGSTDQLERILKNSLSKKIMRETNE